MIPSALQQDPTKVALVTGEGELTFGALARLVSVRRAQFSLADQYVVLAPERVLADLVTIYAAMEARLPLVLLHGRWTDAERARALATVHAHFEPDGVGEEATLAVVFTSGTTGEPKAVRISRRAVLAAARASEANLPWAEDDRWLLSLPLSTWAACPCSPARGLRARPWCVRGPVLSTCPSLWMW
jgi:acyl-CoA synthetase (AMP-forming)/AMP-acid ligase II